MSTAHENLRTDPDRGSSYGSSKAEALARRLETEITAQSLAPGSRLGTKSELRQRFKVGVATVNEALRLMESRGFVAARPGPGGGVFVATAEPVDGVPREPAGNTVRVGFDWDRATLRHCLEVRNALEPLVYRQAARFSTPRDITLLEACVELMRATLGDERAYVRANWAFHRQAVAVCRNPPLRSMYLAVLEFLEAGLDDFDFDASDERAIAVHRELAAAIAVGEGERLEQAIRGHAERSPLPW